MKENSSKIVILVQAPADIPYVLDIVSKHEGAELFVYVIQVENNYKLLKLLIADKVHLEYIPYPFIGYNSIKKILRSKKEFSNIWNKQFKTISKQSSDVFFFSIFEDAFTGYLIGRLSRNKHVNIHYVNHYNPPKSSLRFNDILRCIVFNTVLFYITRAYFSITYWGKFPKLSLKHYKNIVEEKKELVSLDLNSFLFSVERLPAALFLVNPRYDVCGFDFDDSIEKLKQTAIALKKMGLIIYVKGHPRMGLPKELSGVYDERIEDYVISELIDYSKFSIIVGCESTAIAHAALEKKNATVSILPMLKIVNEEKFRRSNEYLKTQSHNNIRFVKTIDEILSIYENRSN